ncbi:MAG: mandelate racemase/muconate lactonizing enzyme family protein [Pseudomonadales bacterium]
MQMISSSYIIPLPPVDWGDGIEKDTVLLELTSPEGITGLGSAYTSVNQMREGLTRYQQDPAILQNFDADMATAMSAIDIALWDIRGKEQNLPVSELLGGRKRDRVLAYATVMLPFTSAIAGDAFDKGLRAILAQGFKAIKLSIDFFGHRDNSRTDNEWDRDEAKLLAFARRIVGKDIQLMLDVFGSDPDWAPELDWAVKNTKVLEELDYLWFEEPLSPDAFDDYSTLTQGSQIAIAGGEYFILLEDFEKISTLMAMDIVQPDCTRVGGLTQMLAIRSAASQQNIKLIPHGWNTAVGLAADLQLQATLADEKFCMVEYMPHSIITDLLKHNPFALDSKGTIAVPTGTGLGIELKDEFRA